MRLHLLSATLSLALASVVIAAPLGQSQESVLKQQFEDAAFNVTQILDCDSCVAMIEAMKKLASVSTNATLDSINFLCQKITGEPVDVCTGLTYLQGPVFLDSLMTANVTGGDGKEMCYNLAGLCPAPAISSGTLTFPKPKPENATAPNPSGMLVDVLHLSDWHVDNEYVTGSEAICGKPTCCRVYSDSPATPLRAAASWGDYNCGTAPKLAEDMVKNIPSFTNSSFAIMTGDIPPHDIWLENQTTVVPTETIAFNIMARLNITMYPNVGNHEAGPTNLFPTIASGGNISWLYDSLADDWSRWLPQDALNSARNYGAFTVSPQPGFRIISLNTNFCYTLNLYLYAHVSDYDPNGQLQWLITQLQAAEDAGERVWILGHVAPSQTDCIQNWSALYYQVVARYSPHVIAEQFFGHSHYDEFALYYDSDEKTYQSAVATAWIGPSVTPYVELNPGFRVYKVDNGSWNIFESYTYIANLSLASTWDATNSTPQWTLEYSARETYGAYVPIADNAPLSASWWHNVTTAFQNNDAAFQMYWTLRGKSADKISACLNSTSCPSQMICDLRAGRSNDTCTPITFIGQNITSVQPTDLTPHYKRRLESKPWNVKLCGSIFN